MSDVKTGVAEAFVPVVGTRIIANAVGSTEAEVDVNLSLIALSDEEIAQLQILPCRILVDIKLDLDKDAEETLNSGPGFS